MGPWLFGIMTSFSSLFCRKCGHGWWAMRGKWGVPSTVCFLKERLCAPFLLFLLCCLECWCDGWNCIGQSSGLQGVGLLKGWRRLGPLWLWSCQLSTGLPMLIGDRIHFYLFRATVVWAFGHLQQKRILRIISSLIRSLKDMALKGPEYFRRQSLGPKGIWIPHKNLFKNSIPSK